MKKLNFFKVEQLHGISLNLMLFLVNYVEESHGGLYKVPAKEESERPRGEGDQIKFIDLRFERWQVVRLRKARWRQEVPQIACSWDE